MSRQFSKLLGAASAAFPPLYQRAFSTMVRTSPLPLVHYTRLGEITNYESEAAKYGQVRAGLRIDLGKDDAFVIKTQDIEGSEADKFGQLMIISDRETRVSYGPRGIAPSESRTVNEMLRENHLVIPPRSFGALDIQKHVPFRIRSDSPDTTLVITGDGLEKAYDHKENIERYSIDTICPLVPEQAKQLSLALQTKIFHDRRNEYFYEEVTSKVYKPTEYNRSSGTLMNFTNHDPLQDKTTAMHYHPGERSLIIVTTNKRAAVTLNFCGIEESPDERKDCEKDIKFPENSMIVLNFPSYTHHKFHGEFDCMSIHPKEGPNLIEAVKKGTLPRGFLESATVFSITEESQEKWNLSLPKNESKEKSEENYRGR